VLDDSLDNPLIPLLNYVNDNSNRYFYDSELAIWLFLVLLEHQFLSEGFKVGFSEVLLKGIDARYEFTKAKNLEGLSNYKGFIPMEVWIPEAAAKHKLSTTRYRVMHYMIQNYALPDKNSRNHMHLHGKKFLTLKRGSQERVLCMNTALDAFYKPEKHSYQFKNLLMLLFRSAEVFEMLQLVQFRIGSSSANKIVKDYACFSDVANDFYHEIQKYSNLSS